MRRRMTVGGAIVLIAGIIAGTYFGKIPGLGTGSGETQVGLSSPISPTQEKPSESDEKTAEKSATTPVAKPPLPADLNVLHVVVETDGYSLRTAGADGPVYTTVDLNEIAERATQAQGDESGIRVRITSRSAARVTPLQLLRQRLAEIGLQDAEVAGLNDLTIEAGSPQP